MKEFVRHNKKIFISETVLSLFEKHKQIKDSDLESGGILLCQIKEDNVFILSASTPNNFDRASRNQFECNKDAAQIIINYEFHKSDCRTIYIGEWHTHPEKIPTPSRIDMKMIRNQFKKNKLNEAFLILIIQGLQDLYVALYDGKKLHIS